VLLGVLRGAVWSDACQARPGPSILTHGGAVVCSCLGHMCVAVGLLVYIQLVYIQLVYIQLVYIQHTDSTPTIQHSGSVLHGGEVRAGRTAACCGGGALPGHPRL
jgi:hypothetical protein